VGGADTLVTRCYSGKPMRVIRNPYAEGFERRGGEIHAFPLQMLESARQGVLDFTHEERVDAERTCMPAGQGAGGVHEVLPVAEIVRRMLVEAEETLARLSRLLGTAPRAGHTALA
jgi:enoyl-[acyl-carrier protein] reductase II